VGKIFITSTIKQQSTECYEYVSLWKGSGVHIGQNASPTPRKGEKKYWKRSFGGKNMSRSKKGEQFERKRKKRER
jgi:hypothetical protein